MLAANARSRSPIHSMGRRIDPFCDASMTAAESKRRPPGGWTASVVAGRPLVGHELPELAAPRGMAQLAQRVRLDLADALAGQAELLADLLQRPWPAVVEAEAEPEHPLLTPLEAVEDLADLLL